MTGDAQARLLEDGRRLHLHHGPIDLIIEAIGPAEEVRQAYAQACAAFRPLLADLVKDLARLRRPWANASATPASATAARMVRAVRLHHPAFITPMAAVAGAVAETVLAALLNGRDLTHAYVNNSGDIAFHVTPGHPLTLGLVTRLDQPRIDGRVTLSAEGPVRGVATSGQGGRSLSFGIADAVTVFATTAAEADAAATLIANAVTVDHPAISRRPARQLDPASDLGDRLVVDAVGWLPDDAIVAALDAGRQRAQTMLTTGMIAAAHLALRGQTRRVGPLLQPVQAPGSAAASLAVGAETCHRSAGAEGSRAWA